MFPNINEFEVMLEKAAEQIPPIFYQRLSGGINLMEQEELHPEAREGELYVLGRYFQERMGRRIEIYYGSFRKIFPYASQEQLEEEILEVLLHEFTHHMEALAGERNLEIKDKMEMEAWKKRRDGNA